jgi:hypothetical protein
VVVPAFQVVRRPVVQMVMSRHSSLSDPSTTVRAEPVPRWAWGAVVNPAGQPSSHASASGLMRRGTDQGRSGGPVDNPTTLAPGSATLPEGAPIPAGGVAGCPLATRLASWVVRPASRASGQAVAAGGPTGSRERMRVL